MQKFLHGAEYAKESYDIKERLTKVLSRATYLSIFYAGKLLSGFELSRGYTPSFLQLPKTQLSAELVKDHQVQVAGRAFAILLKYLTQQMLSF